MTSTPVIDPTAGAHRPSTYRVTVAGHLDDHWADWLDALTLTRDDDASTSLTIPAGDQAQLHGVLDRIRDKGVTLLGLHTVDDTRSALTRTLRTERLTLRPATTDDVDTTWAYRQLAVVNEWLAGVPGSHHGYRNTFVQPARLAATVIVERAGGSHGQVIGDFMLRVENAWCQAEVSERTQAELGWVLHPAHTRSGYATEAVRELLRYSFDDLRLHRVVASCFLDNTPSWHLMERIGMRRESHAVGDSLHRSGRWLDTVGYALLASEWTGQTTHSRPSVKEST